MRAVSLVLALSLIPATAAAQPAGDDPAKPAADATAPEVAPPPSLPADDTPPLGQRITLPEALQIAVRQSPDLALASIDVEIARARVLTASGVDDWLLAAGFV